MTLFGSCREEIPGDRAGILEVHRRAFGSDAEARLVEALRLAAPRWISWVVEDSGRVVGHILFTPVRAGSASPDLRVMGLGPMAVLPAQQRRGIGSRLVEAGLAACRKSGEDAVVVLGHPEFYPRFGFRPASTWDLHFKSPRFDPAFMAIELTTGALEGAYGNVEYLPAFDEV